MRRNASLNLKAPNPQITPAIEIERPPLGQAPLTEGNDLASGPTFSSLENACTRKDIYRLAKAFVETFIASYAKPPSVIVLDMEHSEDRTHGQ